MTTFVTLKKPTLDDLDFIQWLWGDAQTMEPVGGIISLSDDQARKWFSKMVSPGSVSDSYRIILNQERTPIGEVSFHRLDFDSMTADFNIKIAYKYRGQGFALQAMDLFLDYFFNQCGGQIMQDQVAKNNLVGKTVLLKFGFVEIPTDEDYFLLVLCKERFNELQVSKNEEAC